MNPKLLEALTPSLLVSASAATVSLASFVLAIVAYRRAARIQNADYRPHVSFEHAPLQGATEADEQGSDEPVVLSEKIKYEGTLTNTGTKPVQLAHVRVLLGPRHRDDPDTAVFVPIATSLAPGAKTTFSYELPWSTVWSIARQFNTHSVEWTMKLTLTGADQVTREQVSRVGSLLRAEEWEWLALERKVEIEALQLLYQMKIRGSRPKADQTQKR